MSPKEWLSILQLQKLLIHGSERTSGCRLHIHWSNVGGTGSASVTLQECTDGTIGFREPEIFQCRPQYAIARHQWRRSSHTAPWLWRGNNTSSTDLALHAEQKVQQRPLWESWISGETLPGTIHHHLSTVTFVDQYNHAQSNDEQVLHVHITYLYTIMHSRAHLNSPPVFTSLMLYDVILLCMACLFQVK